MATKRSVPPKTDNEKLDQIRARGAWVAIFLALAGIIVYVVKSGDTVSGVLLAIFFPVISAVIAYLFNPGDKQIILHLLREWKTALVLALLLAMGLGSAWAATRETPPPPPEKVIKIGVDLPLTGSDKADGQTVLKGIKLAEKEAKPYKGYRFQIEAKSDDNDYTGLNDPKIGADNVRGFLKDGRVAGIIGPYNSAVAVKVIPIINGDNEKQQTIATISPSTTADCLTTHTYPEEGCDNLNNSGAFFRIAALNSKKGEVFANCLSAPSVGPGDLCPNPNFHLYKNVVVIDDSTSYSMNLAQSFRQFWEAKGNKAVARRVSTKASEGSLRGALTDAVKEMGSTPDLVFFAGSEGNSLTLHQVMQQTPGDELPNMTRTPFAAGAAIMNDNFVKHLRRSSPKGPVYAVAPIKNLDTENTDDQKDSREFIKRYQREYHSKPTTYSAAGYDATKILIQAIKAATGNSVPPSPDDPVAVQEFRNQVIESIKHPADDSVTGVTGQYSFMPNGDYRDAAVSVYKWNPRNPNNQNGWDYQ